METTLLQTRETKTSPSSLLFNVPTPITNLEPIFTFRFNLADFPSVTISLNPSLKSKKNDFRTNKIIFDETGYCEFSIFESDEYFIRGEMKLVSSSRDELTRCKIIVDYGKGEKEQFLLKGTFNLSDFAA